MIRFLAKVAMQRTLGGMPGGEAAYAWLQRHATGSTAYDAQDILGKRRIALRLLARLQDASGQPVASLGPHLEIGSGWYPVTPMLLWQMGVRCQHLTDIRRILRADAVARIARQLNEAGPGLPALPSGSGDGWVLLRSMGIGYSAPATPPFDIAAASCGLVTAFQVLNFPPRAQLRALFAEVARVARPGGCFLAATGLHDLHALGDPALSKFNFLRYGEAAWQRWIRNPMVFPNRLRAPEYRELLEGLPFELLRWTPLGGGEADLRELARIRPHRDFARFTPEELATSGLWFILRRL